MKNILFFSAFILLSISAFSQITLNSSTHTPIVGDQYDYFNIANPSGNLSATGANKTWDFSSYSGVSGTFDYISLSSSSLPTTFTSANIVESSAGSENYYIKNSAEYSIVGQYVPGQVKLTFTDKRELLKFPLAYNDVYNETFAGTIESIQSGQSFSRSGNLKIEATGHGSLILPYATIQNVLKVDIIANYSDIYMGTTLYDYVDTISMWFNAQTNNFIASHSVLYANGTQFVNSASYISQNSIITSMEEANENVLKIYPQPAEDYIIIENAKNVEFFEIRDIRGKLIKNLELQNGTNKFNISDLPMGVYILKYAISNKNYTEKLIIK